MSSIGTFGSFTQARLAIYASQAGLSVTGNNISNINTDGYTRQKLDQTSFYAGGTDRYYSKYDIRVGNGVLATSVSQLRDPYLDIRYRSEEASVGAMDGKLAGLETIQSILDEVGAGENGEGVLFSQFSDFLNQLEQLSDQTGLEEYDIQVRSSAQSIVDIFHSYSTDLQEAYDNAVKDFNQQIKSVNEIITNIRDLNDSIRKADIHGDNALELRDQRNELIDQLSYYMKINARYEMESIGGGVEVEKLIIELDNDNPGSNTANSVLVNGVHATQLLVPTVNPKYNPDDPTSTALKYLTADGEETDDPTKAKVAEIADDNPFFDISLDALKDSKGRILTTTELKSTEKRPLNANEDPTASTPQTDPNTGITTIVTYQKISEDVKDADGNVTTPAQYIVKTYERTTSSTVEPLHDNDLYGALQAKRELLTEEGEYSSQADIDRDPNATSKRGYKFYMSALDSLANEFATAFNNANQGYVHNEKGEYVNINPDTGEATPIKTTVTNADGTTSEITLTKYMELTDDQKNLLKAQGTFLGGPLFSNSGDGNLTGDPNETVPAGKENPPITASNISISLDWSNSDVQIVNSFEKYGNLEIGTTDSSNVAHMISMLGQDFKFNPKDVVGDAVSTEMFEGTFVDMWDNISSILGNDIMSTTTMLDTYYASSLQLDTSRDSVSSVDLNDEAMNLMQYSKSYNAACRLMTTIDSVLDKLINGTGMTT